MQIRDFSRHLDWNSSALKKMGRMMLCGLGAGIGLSMALLVVGISNPFMLASLGGTTVFLFGMTRAPAAQPRALFGGHFGGALIGILCYQAWGDQLWVYVVAVILTMVFMLLTKTVHPPAGANPLIMIHSHATISALWQPVGLGIVLLVLVAYVWTRLVPGMVHYPVKWLDRSPPSTFWGGWED